MRRGYAVGELRATRAVPSEQGREIELDIRQHQRPDQAGRIKRKAGGVARLLREGVAVHGHRAACHVDEPDLGGGEAGV